MDGTDAGRVAAGPAGAFKIAIDPGHGGTDPGAVGCDLEEAAVNLDISLKLRDELVGAGQTVVLTRSTDATTALSQRSSFANAQGGQDNITVTLARFEPAAITQEESHG